MLSAVRAIPQEHRRETLGAFATLLLIMAGHALLETARDALFLARLAPRSLPWVYLIIAMIALVLTVLHERRVKQPGRVALAAWLGLSTAVTAGFWVLIGSLPAPPILFALYAWSGVFATIVVVRFWLVLQDRFTITEAKRQFSFIGAGSVAGAIAGTALARGLAEVVEARSFLLVAALLFALATLSTLIVIPRRAVHPADTVLAPSRHPFLEAARLVRKQPYLSRVGLLVLLSTVALTVVDYVFKSAVARNVPARELASFFATVYLALNLLSLAAQVLVVGRLLRSVALSRVLALLPALLCLGSLGVVLGGSLIAALVLKVMDGGLRYSLHRTVTELLYVPLSDDVRSRVKGFVDVIGQRGGQAIASFAILGALGLGRGDAVLGGLALGASVLWMLVALDFRRHYLDHFRTTLDEGAIRSRIGFPALDLDSLEALMSALSSEKDAEVVAALEILAAQGRTRLVPALILYHPSPGVVLRALELFAGSGRRDFLPIAARLLAHPDPELRSAVLRALVAAGDDLSRVKSALEDPSPIVHSTALVALVAAGGGLGERFAHSVNAFAEGGSIEARLALARAIRHQPAPVFADAVVALAASPEPEVVREVVGAMAMIVSPRFLPLLLPMLGRRELRAGARAAFAAQGEPALAALARALDGRTDPGIRRHLPRTISHFEPQRAASILLPRLLSEPDGVVRFKVLRALGRLRVEHPTLRLDPGVVTAAAERALGAAFRALAWRSALEIGAAERPERSTSTHQMLVELLRDKEGLAVERLFRLLALLDPREDYQRIYRGLRGSDLRVRASSRELLQNLLRPPLLEAVLAIVDDLPDGERLARGGAYLPAPVAADYEAVVAALLERPSPPLRALAAYHAGELRLVGLRAAVAAARDQDDGFARDALEHALQLLDETGNEPAVAARGGR